MAWWCALASIVVVIVVANVQDATGNMGLFHGMWGFLGALAFFAPFLLCLVLL